MQVGAARKQDKATANALLMDQERKGRQDKEALAIFDDQLGASDPQKALRDADQRTAETVAAVQGLTGRPGTGFGAEPNAAMQRASPVVKEAAGQSLATELQRAEGQMKARATLQGLRRRQQDRGTQLGRAMETVGMLGGFNQGWGNVNQIDMAAAKQAGSGQAMLGDVLTMLGSAGLGMAGAGVGAGAAAAGESAAAGTGLVAGSTLEQPLAAGAAQGLKAPSTFSRIGSGISYGLR